MVKAWFQDKEWLAVAKKAPGSESTIVSGELTISASDQHHNDQRAVMKRVKWPGSQTDPFFGRTIPHLGPSDISDWVGDAVRRYIRQMSDPLARNCLMYN